MTDQNSKQRVISEFTKNYKTNIEERYVKNRSSIDLQPKSS